MYLNEEIEIIEEKIDAEIILNENNKYLSKINKKFWKKAKEMF